MKRKTNKVEELAKLLLILCVRKLRKSGTSLCRGNLKNWRCLSSQQTTHGRNVTEKLLVQISDLRPSRLIFARGVFRGFFLFHSLQKIAAIYFKNVNGTSCLILSNSFITSVLTRDGVVSRVSESVVQ